MMNLSPFLLIETTQMDAIIEQIPPSLQAYNPYIVLSIIGLAALIVLAIFFNALRKLFRRPKHQGLQLNSFQLAPFGTDAFLQINNPTEPVTILSVKLLKNKDIRIKNEVTGHLLGAKANYSILLESTNNHKIEPKHKISIVFSDERRYTYEQIFDLKKLKSLSLKYK